MESNTAHAGNRIESLINGPPKNHTMPPAMTANCPSPQNKGCRSFGCINQRKISNVLKMASAENAAAMTEILMGMSGGKLIDIRRLAALFQSDYLHCMLFMPEIGMYLLFSSMSR